jgi:hypothetical protein
VVDLQPSNGFARAGDDLALLQSAARAHSAEAASAWARLEQRAAAHAQASQELPPSRLECSCRFTDEKNPYENPPK